LYSIFNQLKSGATNKSYRVFRGLVRTSKQMH
jgi:hypothetical protein